MLKTWVLYGNLCLTDGMYPLLVGRTYQGTFVHLKPPFTP